MSNNKDIVNSYTKGFFIGAVIGAVSGGIAALLFAPKSGKELRRDIAEKSEDLMEKASEVLSDRAEDVSGALNQGRIKADELVRNAKSQADSIIGNAERMIQEAKYRASNTKESLHNTTARVKDALKAGADTFRQEMRASEAPVNVDTELQ